MEVSASAALAVPVATSLDFDAFYAENVDRLVDVFSATLANRAIAEDAAHEAMIRACQKWSKVGEYENPFGWCYRVGLNWATSRWRKHRRELATDVFDDRAARTTNDFTDPALVGALMKLPMDQRAVVVLRLWLDWSSRETAAALDIPEGTVHSRLSRALDRLRLDLTSTSSAPEVRS